MQHYWHIEPAYRHTPVHEAFGTLEAAFTVKGELVAASPISQVQKVTANGKNFYVKTYTAGGKNLRRWIGRSRVQAEWENLFYFQRLGIPTAPLVAYGKITSFGIYRMGALITAEVENARDLASLHDENHPLMRNRRWIGVVSQQLAEYTRRLHRAHFGHLDLKWRNILVTVEEDPNLFFIDCPSGRVRTGPWTTRWFIKDLACLDLTARQRLSKTQRLRFFMDYLNCERLLAEDKKWIHRILGFF